MEDQSGQEIPSLLLFAAPSTLFQPKILNVFVGSFVHHYAAHYDWSVLFVSRARSLEMSLVGL